MIRIPLRLLVAVALTALGLALLIWSFSAPERIVRRRVILPKQMMVAGAAMPETRRLILEYPATIRAGEADRLRLDFEVQENATDAGIVNAYETYQVIAESRLEMAGMNLRPAGSVSEALLPGQRVTFFWSVRPDEVGKTQGTVWLYLRFIPKAGGPEIRQPISAQTIEIESTTFLGLRAEAATVLGVMGLLIGVALSFSFLVDGIKWILKKNNRSAI